MTYTYGESSVLEKAQGYINQFAAKTYDENGTPLYDYIRTTSRDEDTLKGYMRDALNSLLVRMRDYYVGVASGTSEVHEFYLPDFNTSLLSQVTSEIDRYVAYACTARWLRDRHPSGAEQYAADAAAAADKAALQMLARKPYARE